MFCFDGVVPTPESVLGVSAVVQLDQDASISSLVNLSSLSHSSSARHIPYSFILNSLLLFEHYLLKVRQFYDKSVTFRKHPCGHYCLYIHHLLKNLHVHFRVLSSLSF